MRSPGLFDAPRFPSNPLFLPTATTQCILKFGRQIHPTETHRLVSSASFSHRCTAIHAYKIDDKASARPKIDFYVYTLRRPAPSHDGNSSSRPRRARMRSEKAVVNTLENLSTITNGKHAGFGTPTTPCAKNSIPRNESHQGRKKGGERGKRVRSIVKST